MTPQDAQSGADDADQPDAPFSTYGESNENDALRAELNETKDRLLRERAELENYRKRARRELEDERRYANMPLIRDLAPVIDTLERALEAGKKATDVNTLLDGFRMVAQLFDGVLQKHHCRRIAALGEPFDPHRHEAIMQQPSDEVAPNTVLAVTQVGYELHDRVVRPALVIVSSPPPAGV